MLYQVQTGDTAASIARKFTGQPGRSHELVLANPSKPWMQSPQGALHFQTLQVGEMLRVPTSFTYRTGLNGVGVGADTTANADVNLANYLQTNGCDCSQQQAALTILFQQKAGLAVDGKYGTQTQAALAQSLGTAAPPPCFSAGNPCFGNDAGANAAMAAAGLGGGGSAPAPKPAPAPGTTPVSTLPTTSSTNWTPWIIAGVAVLAGAGLYVAAKKRGMVGGGSGRHTVLPPAPAHRARRLSRA